MNPMLLPLIVGGLVVTMVVLLYLAFNKGGNDAAADRLDALVNNRGIRKESSADLLLKQAIQEADKRTLLDRLTPGALNLTKWFEQADANIKPSALFGISLALAVVGAALCVWLVNIYVVPIMAVLFFALPWLWLWQKRATRLKAFAGQLPDAMELIARACEPATRWPPACTWWRRKCPPRSARNSPGFTTNRTSASPWKKPSRGCATGCPTSTCGSS